VQEDDELAFQSIDVLLVHPNEVTRIRAELLRYTSFFHVEHDAPHGELASIRMSAYSADTHVYVTDHPLGCVHDG